MLAFGEDHLKREMGVMNKRCHAPARAALAIAAVLALPTSSFAQVKVITRL
jgi:hypothetical protein